MAWLSLARYAAYTTRAFDLGAMSQAIWRATQGDPLIFTVEGIAFSRLARHAEFFYFLLAPIYAIWPTPVTLLIVQASLYVLGAIPVYQLARRHLSSRSLATAVSAIYLFYPVAQTAVLFAFHGDTLAMPLLLFAIDALDRGAKRQYGVWLLLALSCKFYVTVPVVALGIVLWLRRQRRTGIMTIIIGFAWFAIILGVVRPYFSPPEAVQVEATIFSYLNYYFGQLNLAETGLIRLSNAVIVIVPVLLLAWRAPLWLFPSLTVIVPVIFSSGPGPSYDYRFHHYALAVPFLLAAFIYGAEAAREQRPLPVNKRRRPLWHYHIGISLLITMIMSSFLVNTPLNSQFYKPKPGSGMGLDPLSGLAVSDRDRFKDAWLMPLAAGDMPMAADRLLASRLVNRRILYLVPPENKPLEELLVDVDYVAVDSLFDFALDNAGFIEGGVSENLETIQELLLNPAWGLLDSRDGLLLFGQEDEDLQQVVDLIPIQNERPFLAQFGDAIGLIDVAITRQENRRYRLRFDWMALRPLSTEPPLIAVSRPGGLVHARIVHLPTLGLLPTTEWPDDQIIREAFEITLPVDIPKGEYPVYSGWYDTSNLVASETDARSRVGQEVKVGVLVVDDVMNK